MSGEGAKATVLARQIEPGLAPRRQPVGDSRARSVAAPRALVLVTELEDYTIAFANGVAAHLPVTLAVPNAAWLFDAGRFFWFHGCRAGCVCRPRPEKPSDP